jgi:hypothetical protein
MPWGRRAGAVAAYRGIGALAELLELLEGAGVSAVVHGRHKGRRVAVAEVAHADGRVGALRGDQSAGVDWLEAARRRARGELGVPEDGRGRRELPGNAQRRRRARLLGGWGW